MPTKSENEIFEEQDGNKESDTGKRLRNAGYSDADTAASLRRMNEALERRLAALEGRQGDATPNSIPHDAVANRVQLHGITEPDCVEATIRAIGRGFPAQKGLITGASDAERNDWAFVTDRFCDRAHSQGITDDAKALAGLTLR